MYIHCRKSGNLGVVALKELVYLRLNHDDVLIVRFVFGVDVAIRGGTSGKSPE